MNIRIIRLTMAIIVLASSIVCQAYALKDHNPQGYVDDLSSLPGPEIYQHKPGQYSIDSIVKWIDAHQMLCAAGLTATGFILLYIISADVRHKVHAWLGLRAEQSDEEQAHIS
jgi:hypothetical protein